MKCHKCGHENFKSSKFCSNCGKSFRSSKSEGNYPNQEAMEHFESIRRKRFGNLVTTSILSALIAIIGLFIAYILSDSGLVMAFIGVASLIICANIFSGPMPQRHYYKIPTSKDENGEHHCIFCGNKGIYRRTIYKTTTTINACSKCRRDLFKS